MSSSSFSCGGEISGSYFGLRCDDNAETQKFIRFEVGDFICDGGLLVNGLRHRHPSLFTLDRNTPPSFSVHPASAWGGWLVVRSADWERFWFHYKQEQTSVEGFQRFERVRETIGKLKRYDLFPEGFRPPTARRPWAAAIRSRRGRNV